MTNERSMNWDDPAARARLIQDVGPGEYKRQFEEHCRESTVLVVNGIPSAAPARGYSWSRVPIRLFRLWPRPRSLRTSSGGNVFSIWSGAGGSARDRSLAHRSRTGGWRLEADYHDHRRASVAL